MSLHRPAASLLALTFVVLAASPLAAQPTSQVDWMNSLGEWTRLALSPDGSPNLVWSRFVNAFGSQLSEVRFARWDGLNWQRENADDLLLTESRPAVAVRVDGRIAVAYSRDPGGPAEDQMVRGVVYRHRDPGQVWSAREIVEQVPNAAGAIPPPVAVHYAADGKPRVEYWDNRDLRVHVERRDGEGAWTELTSFGGAPGLPCAGAWADMALDSDGTMHIACITAAQPNNQVKYWLVTPAGVANQEVALPAVPGFTWEKPAITRNGQRVAVVSFLRDQDGVAPDSSAVIMAERTGNVWIATVVAQSDPAILNAFALSVIQRASPSTADRYVVSFAANGHVYIAQAQRLANGTFQMYDAHLADRKCDRPGAFGGLGSDDPTAKGLDLSVGADGTAHLFLHYAQGNNPGVRGTKYIALQLPSPQDGAVETHNKHDMAAGAIAPGHEPWQCFFVTDAQGAAQLEVRRWNPTTLAWEDDVPPNAVAPTLPPSGARGCSIDVASTGKVGVAWADLAGTRLRFAEKAVGGAWTQADVAVGALSPHHELRWSADGTRAVLAFIKTVNNVAQVHVAERTGIGAWSVATSAALGPASFVSLAVDGAAAPTPRVAFVSGANVKYVRRTSLNAFGAVEVVHGNVNAIHPSLSLRTFGSLTRELVAYYDVVNTDLMVRERNWAGLWNQTLLHDAGPGLDAGRTPSLQIDSFGRPVVAFRNSSGGTLGFIRWNRMKGPAPVLATDDPPGGWDVCDADEGGLGPAMRIDAHDNLQASHRGLLECPMPQIGGTCTRPIQFTARP
jgi:hypothetical protein